MPQPRKRSKVKTGCGTIVALLVLMIVLGAIFGNSKSGKHSSASVVAATAPTKTQHTATPTKTQHTATPTKTQGGRHWPRYAGVGATIAAFKHDNTMFCTSCALQTGEAAYNIKATRNGRVTEYSVSEAFRPPASAATRMSLVAGTMIPGPITAPVRQSKDCIDYRVPQLKKSIGVEYAEASTSPGVNFAVMQAVSAPTCP